MLNRGLLEVNAKAICKGAACSGIEIANPVL
jgi:hypothetical protein